MSSAELPPAQTCPHCGNPYRTPIWGREYLCPACASPLSEALPRRPGGKRLRSAAYALLALVAVGGGARAVAQWRGHPPMATSSSSDEVRQVLPAAGTETRIRERLRLIQADLQVDPKYPLLLGRATECCLALALLERERDPDQARRWIDQAALYLRPLKAQGIRAASELDLRARNLQSLRWSYGPIDSARFSPANAAPESLTAFPFRLRRRAVGPPPGGLGPEHSSPGPTYLPARPEMVMPPDRPRLGPPTSTAVMEQGAPRPAGYPSVSSNGPAGYPTGAGSPTPPRFSIESRPGAPAPPPDRVSMYRAALAKNPRDLDATWRLAEALDLSIVPHVVRGDMPESSNHELAAQAVRLYLRAAELSRTHVQRGTFYYSAARVWERLGEDEKSYALVKKALEEAPYSVTAWQGLRDVCVRLGRFEEGERATAEVRRWSTPDAVL